MIEERFESYVYQIMQYVKYQENKPYIESILEEMRYTLFREDRNYIKQLEQRIDKAINKIYKIIESNISALSNPEYTIVGKHELLKLSNQDMKELLEILGDKENESNM